MAAKHQRPTEQVRFWRDPNFGYFEARYSRDKISSFPKHTHETLSVGVVEQGWCTFYYQGQFHQIGPGEIAVIPPGVVHACNPQVNAGWTYRMFYIDPYWLRSVANEVTQPGRDIPNFSTPVVQNPAFFHTLTRLHTVIESPADRLEKETFLYATFSHLVTHYSDRTPPPSTRFKKSQAVKLALDYLTDNRTQNVSLDKLSSLTGLSAYHFLRVFRNTVGLPPHAYQTQLRINLAKQMLAQGKEIIDVAHDTGFTDQSHFSNKFKQMVGATPRQYKLAQHSSR
jgi:AraC-like DNA-binding protein/quercetin dioxygenase-like cupin family protein